MTMPVSPPAHAERSATPREEYPTPFGDFAVETLSPPMRRLVKALLLYKSMFASPWFTALSAEEEPEMRALYERIKNETTGQAYRAFDLLRRWDSAAQGEKMQEVTNQVLKQLLEDMLSLKKSSTEVFLGAGLTSPTEEFRREFLNLADIDRRHAEALRSALGINVPTRPGASTKAQAGFPGVHAGPFPPGTLSETIQKALAEAKGSHNQPTRIVLSSMALRHLRDEGSVAPGQGDVFGYPADVDFSWESEAFSIASRSRVSLAEIVTQMEAEPRERD